MSLDLSVSEYLALAMVRQGAVAGVPFGEAITKEQAKRLEADGLVRVDGDRVVITAKGAAELKLRRARTFA